MLPPYTCGTIDLHTSHTMLSGQDLRDRVSQTYFSSAAAWKRPSFSPHMFAVGEHVG